MLPILDVLKQATLKSPRSELGPLRSSLAAPATPAEIREIWHALLPPQEVVDLWLAASESRLFEDVTHGQWGLLLLNPVACLRRTKDALATRPEDFRSSDVVLGEFRGDSDVLVYSPAEDGHATVMIALPLDPRKDWHHVADSLIAFLAAFIDASGEKYWENIQH